MPEEVKKSLEYWNEMHKYYEVKDIHYDDWLESFSDVIARCETPVIDLGCGVGNDTLYLISKDKKVVACDYSINAIKNIQKNLPLVYDTKCFNMVDGFSFEDNYTNLIVADLCLHYFKEEDMIKIVAEIKRVLTPSGNILLRLNSINDFKINVDINNEIEHHLYKTTDGRLKKYFDENDIKHYFKDFEIIYLKEEPMKRYPIKKMVYKCHLQMK